jgi:hypothetical protein
VIIVLIFVLKKTTMWFDVGGHGSQSGFGLAMADDGSQSGFVSTLAGHASQSGFGSALALSLSTPQWARAELGGKPSLSMPPRESGFVSTLACHASQSGFGSALALSLSTPQWARAELGGKPSLSMPPREKTERASGKSERGKNERARHDFSRSSIYNCGRRTSVARSRVGTTSRGVMRNGGALEVATPGGTLEVARGCGAREAERLEVGDDADRWDWAICSWLLKSLLKDVVSPWR